MTTPSGTDAISADNPLGRAALCASESHYRRIFEAAQDGILLLNAVTGQIEDVNPFLIDLLGYSHEEFLGKKLWDVGAFKAAAVKRSVVSESIYAASFSGVACWTSSSRSGLRATV